MVKYLKSKSTGNRPEVWKRVMEVRGKKGFMYDEFMRLYGHVPLRTPPYHPELQPIELVWKQLKDFIRANRVEYTMEELHRLLDEAIASITTEMWRKCIAHARKWEEFYWVKDGLLATHGPMYRKAQDAPLQPGLVFVVPEDSDSDVSEREAEDGDSESDSDEEDTDDEEGE